MRYLIILTTLVSLLFSITKNDVYEAYKDKQYKRACQLAMKVYLQHRKDSDFITLFADSCLKVDSINRTSLATMLLIRNKEARNNAIYFSTIYYQKKLLYSALVDGVDVSKYNFPTTNYILSKIFVKFVNKDYKKKNGVYIFKGDDEKTYRMSLENENGIYKIYIRTFLNGKLVRTRVYW